MPGQTASGDRLDAAALNVASMEGRAIARPNSVDRSGIVTIDFASMEGRAIARPNSVDRSGIVTIDFASMEGRAIARPNFRRPRVQVITRALQWRAGQLPGQTGS